MGSAGSGIRTEEHPVDLTLEEGRDRFGMGSLFNLAQEENLWLPHLELATVDCDS